MTSADLPEAIYTGFILGIGISGAFLLGVGIVGFIVAFIAAGSRRR